MGASVASQYFTHSGLFSEQHEAANINLGDAQTDFAHNGANLYEDTAHNIANQTKAMLDPATHPDLADASQINVNVYSGTDTVVMMKGQTRATLSEYTRLLNEAKDYINTTPLDATTKANALEYLNNHTWENVHGMTNDYLGYIRGLKSFEGIVQGHIDSGSTIPLDFHYVTGTKTFTDKVGGGILNITEKAVDGAFGVKDRILASFIPVVAGLTSNTFRRNGKDVEKPQYGKDAILVRNNKQGEVDLVKVDTNNRPLAGAKFVVKDANGKVIDSWETDDQPHKITGLNAGTYTVVETDPPAGHQLSDEAMELIVDNEGKVTKRKISRSQVPVTPIVDTTPEKNTDKKKEKEENTEKTEVEKIAKKHEELYANEAKIEKVFEKYPQL
ncbi:MAG: prealbumin-like fold domain-containing protein [Candidatus Peribacteria bacterium]|nr:prealbumin-like fold domain-containing protein [Candidatus Peribacteria bacterium]